MPAVLATADAPLFGPVPSMVRLRQPVSDSVVGDVLLGFGFSLSAPANMLIALRLESFGFPHAALLVSADITQDISYLQEIFACGQWAYPEHLRCGTVP
ncbi:MAG: hypothetical protein UY72_C0080G0007 [Candidatus Uhrbacteria bacterium GW2011_GWD2_52_7]|uniref:Uncharacterized protein n=1 Tax=Candidatus Uhrbacteria bacterium GW2011_GWD2_52_7 TaxID=1618989 RepID=A0A0G2A7C8_9BACT|nr:MAG: hypothetical protein UY72_C0080G0007 [Candidatus Uhrbacteria bacterium GW2011_GWD2_52_7]